MHLYRQLWELDALPPLFYYELLMTVITQKNFQLWDYCMYIIYIALNFDRGNHNFSDFFQLDSQNLTRWKCYSIYRYMLKDSNHPSKYFPSNTLHQIFILYGVCICITGKMCYNFYPKLLALRNSDYNGFRVQWNHKQLWLTNINTHMNSNPQSIIGMVCRLRELVFMAHYNIYVVIKVVAYDVHYNKKL